MNPYIFLVFISCLSLLKPEVSFAQTKEEVIITQKEKSSCLFRKKKANKSPISTPKVDLMYTKELVLAADKEPLHNLNGEVGTKLKVVLFEYWKSEMKSTEDSLSNQLIDFDKQDVSYLIDVVSTAQKQEIVSITLQVKKNDGAAYATLIFCVQEIQPLLQKHTVNVNGTIQTVWEYLQGNTYPSKEVSVVKLVADSFPCYFK